MIYYRQENRSLSFLRKQNLLFPKEEKMKHWPLVVLAIIVVVGIAYAVSQPASPVQAQTVKPAEQEVGNLTYLPINRYGTFEQNFPLVVVISKWETSHPDREIIDIDYQQRYSDWEGNFTFGAIIYSRPKR